jgi:DNA-binding CsgD family transcriptional regulator
MKDEKLIIIGCDDTVALAGVLRSMKDIVLFSPDIITATRVSDLISIVKSLDPDLVILSFRNNQLVLSDFNTFVKKPEIPVLCLTKKFESEALDWNKNCIVFTYPLEHINNGDYLGSRINSIFLLKSGPPKQQETKTFAEAAIQRNSPDNNRNLSRYVLELDQKVDALLKIKDRISHLYPRVDDPTKAELTSIVNSIKLSAADSKLWDDFKLYFEQTNPNFLLKLAEKYPQLTSMDLKYCCYLLMNMTNDDIRSLLGISQESVRTHKYRLKKKMELPKEKDLKTYLRSVG